MWLKKFQQCLIYCIIAGYPSLLWAQIYKWTDTDGTVHFSDKPVSKKAKTVIFESTINNYTPLSAPKFDYTPRKKSGKPAHARPNVQAGQVIMYSTAWCGYCKKAKAYFQKKGINYSERDIEKSPKARNEHISLGGGGVPLILIGKHRGQEVMRGFSADRFEKLSK